MVLFLKTFLVELQTYNVLLDWEMSSFVGIFKDFTWILGAFFFSRKEVAATIVFFVVVSFCLFCLCLFLFLPIFFGIYSIVVENITKLYILLLYLMKKKKVLNWKKK